MSGFLGAVDQVFAAAESVLGISSAGLGPWASARLPASWNGVRFRVREASLKAGRRQAVHLYPFRDQPWVEDLGQAPNEFQLQGFIVGDDVDQQLKRMIAATQKPGQGTLVHPALGSLSVSLTNFAASESLEDGRTWSLEFGFMAGIGRSYPTAAADTQGAVGTAASACTSAVATSFGGVGQTLSNTVSSINAGATNISVAVAGAAATVAPFVRTAASLAGDVTALASVAGLVGNYGRFSLGARLTLLANVPNVTATLATANAAAASVASLGAAANRAASAL